MDCMALEELVYGCTCACVMYVHFFFFSVLFYLSCHASERRFFFSLQTSLSCVCIFLSQSHTHTLSFSLSLAPPPLCQFFPLSFFPIYPPFFSHIFWDPSTSSLLAPTRSVHVIYRHSVTASLDGRLGRVPLDRVVKIGQICTTIESVRSIEYTQSWCIPARYPVSQGLSVIGQRVHAKALKMELFMIDSGMQTEPCSLASSP